MAYQFSFTNKAESSAKALTLFDMGELSNYGMKADDAGYTSLTNLTSPSPSFEVIEFRSNDVKNVSMKAPVENQLSTGAAHKLQVEVQTVMDSTDDEGIVHCEPARCYLTLIHSNAACWTDENLETLISRTISACYNSDGTSRLIAMSKGATKPTRE